MNPRINVGKGMTGCVRYVLGEGRDPKTGELLPDPLDGSSRVAWIGGTGFGFNIKTEAHAELARRIMEFDAQNQKGQARQDCMHLSLSWRPGEKPTREQMEEAARDALKKLGMGNAKALFVCHSDESYPHVHIVASNINPATGHRYDLERSQRKLSAWALDYEREHGGVISTRRETANELRDAIKERDAGRVLEALTKQRSTFTPAQLENALAKEIRGKIERAQFADKILDHAESVHLSDRPGGPTTRYTTRAVLEAEQYVMRAAEGLAARSGFQIDDKQRAQTLDTEKFNGITREQAHAFRHATGAENLALIDGQAGTGKSFTLAAVREAYEAAGHRVIGLAPTNAVAQDMKNDGFGRSATLHSELFALNNGRRNWDSKTVVIVDEAAMLDTKLMAMLTAHAHDAGAKLILVGDDRQLSSIDRGGMFGALKDRYGAAELTEVKRQHKIDERRAAEMMAEGNFHDALNIYNDKGAIHWTRTQGQARAELVEQWTKDSAQNPAKTRFVFAYTNDSVAELNAALRDVRKQRGELGQDHEIDTAHGRHAFAAGDRIQFTGTDKKQGIYNGNAGTIEAIDGSHIAVKLDGKHPKTINFDAANFDQFRHGYAGTIYKGQGKTLDQTYLYHSEHWRSAASYVALTRHRDKAEIFVATNTLNSPRQSEPWMSEKGGAAALSDENIESAKRSYEQWKETNPAAAARHGFADYVKYVQDKWAEKEPEPATGRSSHIATLARQMARTDDRRAASQFHHRQEIGPVRLLSAREVLEHFAGDSFRRQPAENENQRRPRVIEQTAAEMRGARRARPLDRQHRQQRQQQDTGKMDNELDEEEQRRRRNAGVGMIIDIEPRQKAANDHPQWNRTEDGAWEMTVAGERVAALIPNNDPDYPNSWLSNGVGTKDLPEHGWDNVDFGSLEQGKDTLEKWWEHAQRGEAYRPEQPERPQVTREAIDHDPWNAVALDLPIKIGETDPELLLRVAVTARDLRPALEERAEQAATPGQQELWHDHAKSAEARQRLAETLFMAHAHDQPMTAESINYDPWTAVYQPIPANADAALLQKAHDMAMQCAGAVAGEPGPARSAFEPDLFGADQPREVNFQNAVQRIDELDGRLRAVERQQQPETELQQPEPPNRLEQPFAEREGRPFSPSEQRPDRYDKLRTEVTAEPVTIEAIKRDPWNAVALDLPVDADHELLFLVANTSRELRATFAERGNEATSPDQQQLWFDLAEQAKGRQKDAETQILSFDAARAPPVSENDPTREVSDEPDVVLQAMRAEREAKEPEAREPITREVDGEPDVVLQAMRAEREGNGSPEAREPVTLEAIERDPWNAVRLDIPENADALLLNNASFAAMHCFNERQAPDGVSPQEWEDRRDAAGERVKELAGRIDDLLPSLDPAGPINRDNLISCLDHADVVNAWQAPAFSFETISADPWTAVYLPIPQDADQELLTHAASWARDLEQYAARNGASAGPFVDQPPDAPELQTAARERVAELGERIELARAPDPSVEPEQSDKAKLAAETREAGDEPDVVLQAMRAEREGKEPEAREPVTIEAIERDPWNAIILDLPKDASPELYATVAETAQNLLDTPDNEWPPAPFSLPRSDEEWDGLSAQIKTRLRDAQHEILIREPGDEPDVVLQAMRAGREGNGSSEAREPVTRDAEDEPDVVLQAMRAEHEGNGSSEAREPVTREAGDEPDVVLQAMRAEREGNGSPETREPVTREVDGEPDVVLQAMRAEREGNGSPEARKPMTLDDIAERVQQIIDNPDLAGDEPDVVLQAMRARLDGGEFARPDQDYDPRQAQAQQQQSDDTRSRTAADDQPDVKHEGNNAHAREQEQERDGEGEEEHTLEQGGGGRERSLQ